MMKGLSMSFETLKVDELKTIADSFGVDLEDAKNKAEIIAALVEEGVTFDMYSKFSEAEKEQVEEEVEEEVVEEPVQKPKGKKQNTVLVKMERFNPSYETMGFTFTQSHPFVAVPEKVAQDIFDMEEGFRMATPREVQEYYS